MIALIVTFGNIPFIWSYTVTSEASALKFVVSDTGDTLSPKKAPEIIAPATSGKGIPILVAIPINATPEVAADPHEVPVNVETIAVTTNAVTTTNLGCKNFKP